MKRGTIPGVISSVVLSAAVAAAQTPPATNALPDSGNATWHIGLAQMFGTKEETVSKDYNLNFYTVFVNGKFSHALGSARAFNTSLHFVEKAEVAGNSIKVGKQTVTFDGKRIVLGVWGGK